MNKGLFLTAILFLYSLLAGGRGLSERIFLTTDRQVYVAGDMLRCSAFCYDASTRELSGFSAIAYLELHSASSMVQTGRVALVEGRGGAEIRIPANVPTGNYVLVAYTAQNCNEDGFDYMCGARTISIFNTSSTERVENGVNVVQPSGYHASAETPCSGDVMIDAGGEAKRGGTLPVVLRNSGKGAKVSVSVRHEDGISAPVTLGPAEFISGLRPGTSFSENRIPEYEGEIICGRVVGLNPAQTDSLYGKFGFISAPGNKSDVYSAAVQTDGTLTFFTNNIYGDKDLVCEIENMDPDVPCHMELDSPFVDVKVDGIPALELSPSIREALEKRAVSSSFEWAFSSELLTDLLPIRENPLFGKEIIRYNLDDYTRFPTMEEVIVEFVDEMRLRRGAGRKRDIQVRLQDVFNSARFSTDDALMMVDGIPVFDYGRILEYDPLLVESVNIYPYVYFVGGRSFEGIVNFETYKRNMPGIVFQPNVRIVEFHGCPYPSVHTGVPSSDNYPDYRQTAYWHPLVDLQEGGEFGFDVRLPEYSGRFVIEVEGFDAAGNPIHMEKPFEVN